MIEQDLEGEPLQFNVASVTIDGEVPAEAKPPEATPLEDLDWGREGTASPEFRLLSLFY